MKLIVLASSLLVAWSPAEQILAVQLVSEDYQERQNAESGLIEWAREGVSGEESRAEVLFQRYLQSEEPEEVYRLAKVLLAVHFESKKDEIPQSGPGFIGISMNRMQFNRGFFEQGRRLEVEDDMSKGVYVGAVIPGTPAEKAGLLEGDIITAIDGQSIAGGVPSEKLVAIVSSKTPGTVISLEVDRGGKKLEIKVTLMNGRAVPRTQNIVEETRVDFEKADQLLREDYLRWLSAQRSKEQSH